MRVSDLIPWRAERGGQPAKRTDRDPVGALQSNINRAFDDFLGMLSPPFLTSSSPFLKDANGIQVDVVETEKDVKVTAEMPGMTENEIDVRVSDGMLAISGEKKIERETDENGYILRERSFGHVERIVPLPDGIDDTAAEATFKGGVLTVTIPKTAEPRSNAKRIPVQTH
jgi:HSP20 family protein